MRESTGPASFIVVNHPHHNMTFSAVCYTSHKKAQQMFSRVLCCWPTQNSFVTVTVTVTMTVTVIVAVTVTVTVL